MSVRQRSMMVWAEKIRRAYETDGVIFAIPCPGHRDAPIWEVCACWECAEREREIRERKLRASRKMRRAFQTFSRMTAVAAQRLTDRWEEK